MEEESFIPNLASMLEVSLVEDAESAGGFPAGQVEAENKNEEEQTVALNENVVRECDPTEQEVDMPIKEQGYVSDNDFEAEDEGDPSPSQNYQQDYDDYGHEVLLNTKYHAASEECDEELNSFCIKDLSNVTFMRLHCTVCDCHIGCGDDASFNMAFHKVLRVLVCHDCSVFYGDGHFPVGDDGSETFCRWCGQGGQVFCCSHCPSVFCKKCVRRNLGKRTVKLINDSSDWTCYICDVRLLWEHRALCRYLSQFLKEQEIAEKKLSKEQMDKCPGFNPVLCCKGDKITYHRAGQPLRILVVPPSPEEVLKKKEAAAARKEASAAKEAAAIVARKEAAAREEAQVKTILEKVLSCENQRTSAAATSSSVPYTFTNSASAVPNHPPVSRIVPVDTKLLLKPVSQLQNSESAATSAVTSGGETTSSMHVLHKPVLRTYERSMRYVPEIMQNQRPSLNQDSVIPSKQYTAQNPPPLTPIPRSMQAPTRTPTTPNVYPTVNKVVLNPSINSGGVIYGPLPAMTPRLQTQLPRLAPAIPSMQPLTRILFIREGPNAVPRMVPISGQDSLDAIRMLSSPLRLGTNHKNPSDTIVSGNQPPRNIGITINQPPPNIGNTVNQPPPNLGIAVDQSSPNVGITVDQSPPNVGIAVNQPPPNVGITVNESPPNVGITTDQPPVNIDITIDDEDVVEVFSNVENSDKLVCDWLFKIFREVDQTSRLLSCYVDLLRRKFSVELGKGTSPKNIKRFAGKIYCLLEKAIKKLNDDKNSVAKQFVDWLHSEREKFGTDLNNTDTSKEDEVGDTSVEPDLLLDMDCESEPEEESATNDDDVVEGATNNKLKQELLECSETLSDNEIEDNIFSYSEIIERKRKIPAFKPFYSRTVRELLRDKYSCKLLFQLISEQYVKSDGPLQQDKETTMEKKQFVEMSMQTDDFTKEDHPLTATAINNVEKNKTKPAWSCAFTDFLKSKTNDIMPSSANSSITHSTGDGGEPPDSFNSCIESETEEASKLSRTDDLFMKNSDSRSLTPSHNDDCETNDNQETHNELGKNYSNLNGIVIERTEHSESVRESTSSRKRRRESDSSIDGVPQQIVKKKKKTVCTSETHKKNDFCESDSSKFELEYTDINSKPSTSWARPPRIQNHRRRNQNLHVNNSRSCSRSSPIPLSFLPYIKLEPVVGDMVKAAIQKNLIKPCSVEIIKLD